MTDVLEAGQPAAQPEEDLVNGLPRDHFDALNPCLVCGQMSDAGPEGDRHSAFGHCWKCGYRPGKTLAPDVPQARTGLTGAQIEKLTQELRRGVVADILEALKSGASPEQISSTFTPAEGT
jgi:hypothetical protein